MTIRLFDPRQYRGRRSGLLENIAWDFLEVSDARVPSVYLTSNHHCDRIDAGCGSSVAAASGSGIHVADERADPGSRQYPQSRGQKLVFRQGPLTSAEGRRRRLRCGHARTIKFDSISKRRMCQPPVPLRYGCCCILGYCSFGDRTVPGVPETRQGRL